MNKYSKQILKYINKHWSKESPISETTLYEHFKYDKQTINISLKYLEDNNYISSIGTTGDKDVYYMIISCYYPTSLGKDYFKEQCKSTLKYYLKIFIQSIFCPILVSIVTTLITIWLSK